VEAILLAGSKDNITNKTVALMTEAEQASLSTTAGKTILQQAKKGLRIQAFKVTLIVQTCGLLSFETLLFLFFQFYKDQIYGHDS
jgi:hypothetical protein